MSDSKAALLPHAGRPILAGVAGLVLFDHPVSSNALKVRFLLRELGLEFERVHVPFQRPRPDWYTALNPFGGIPTLQDGELTLAESNAILRYLAAQAGRDDLYPRDPAERGRVDWLLDALGMLRVGMWPFESACLFHASIEDGGGSHEDGDPNAIAATRPAAEDALSAYERLMFDNGAVTGTFGLADVSLAPTLFRSYRLPLDFSAWPNLERIREIVCAYPSFLAAEPVG